MFHTSCGAFEEPLENLEVFLDSRWTVRLFLPLFPNEQSSRDQVASCRVKIFELDVVNRLLGKHVQVHCMVHKITDIPFSLPTGALGRFQSGPILANHFALSRQTYDAIEEDSLLFFQQDVAFCAKSLEVRSLSSFMHHPWLGSPWLVHKSTYLRSGTRLNLLYGNGGLSIRSKKFALGCLSQKDYHSEIELSRLGKGIPEDVFFSRCLYETHPGSVNIDEAIAFASEEKYVPGFPVLALHDPCRVADGPSSVGCNSANHKERTRHLVEYCPEVKRVIKRCVAHCDFGMA